MAGGDLESGIKQEKAVEPDTVGRRLFVAYSNTAMAHAALDAGRQQYGRVDYAIRARLFKGLVTGSMSIDSLLSDERVKMTMPRVCAYCGADGALSLDHVVPRTRGGTDAADNIVWCCRSCNSSKGTEDLVAWYTRRGQFPPILLLRRYLKLAVQYFEAHSLMESMTADLPEGPFKLSALPSKFPPPTALTLWSAARAEKTRGA